MLDCILKSKTSTILAKFHGQPISSDKKYGEGGATPPSFDCPADEVLGNNSMVFTPETITALVEYFTQVQVKIQPFPFFDQQR